MQKEIFEYVRTKKGKVGVLFATVQGGVIKIGWSRCNRKEGDTFDAKTGLQIASERARGTLVHQLPQSFNKQARHFGARCIRYFKDAKSLNIPA